MKWILILFVLLSLMFPVFGGSIPGAHWQNSQLIDSSGVPVLSATTNNYLVTHTDKTLVVTTTPKDKKGVGSTYVFGAKIPKDFNTRKFTENKYLGLSTPNITATGGNVNAYVLMGRAWPSNTKKIVMSVKDDSYLTNTGMNKNGVLTAVYNAETIWNDATNKRPFGSSGLTTTANWKYDGVNNMAFTPYAVGCTALAATGVWYKTQGIPTGQMYPIVESDMTFNSNLKWSVTGEVGKLDFQTVVLHELGHTLGLGDIYNIAINDGKQVMGFYTGVRKALGNGDKTGVWKLYG